LVERIQYLEARNELMENIVFGVLDVAVCDYCDGPKPRWFDAVKPEGAVGPLGSANGLVVHGGSFGCCVQCLDKLYEETSCYEDGEMDDTYREVAQWLLRTRPMPACQFARDPEMLALMKSLAP
jgi:hypothetical protein